MRHVLGVVGVAAACGVCCAFPLALPLLGSLTASILGSAFGWEAAALASVVTLVAMVLFVARRRSRRRDMQAGVPPVGVRRDMVQGPGGCGTKAPIACTFPDPEMSKRAAAIASLAQRGLLAHHQCGLSVYLRYSSKVFRELEDLVAQERKYSPFLDFELTHRADAVHLIITAPAAVAELAPALTPYLLGKAVLHFACTPTCGCNPAAMA